MFRKYEKTYRVNDISDKRSLSCDEVKALFEGRVCIEEKLDGSNIGIIRHKKGFHLQKRNSLVGSSEHAQFQYFHAWANNIKYDNIISLPIGTIIYGELLYAVHTIYYDRLPDYIIFFDVWNGKRYLNENEKISFIKEHGFEHVPVLINDYVGIEDLKNIMPDKSFYGDISEGIVIKRYKKSGEYLKGKLVKPEFIKSVEESDHWIHKKLVRNRIYSESLSSI